MTTILTGTVTGRFADLTGEPLAAAVEISLTVREVKHSPSKTLVQGGPMRVALDPAGAFSVSLAASDDPGFDVAPRYRVNVLGRAVEFDLPAGGTVDLADLLTAPL